MARESRGEPLDSFKLDDSCVEENEGLGITFPLLGDGPVSLCPSETTSESQYGGRRSLPLWMLG